MGDYIERDALKEKFVGACKNCLSEDDIADLIDDMPAADVAPVVHARWVECDWLEPCVHGFGTIRYKNKGMKCTNCVHVFKNDILWKNNYCPNCGAKMDLKELPHE